MKIDCGQSKLAKNRHLTDWHPWFAWFPVRLGENDCRWLEVIERKYDFQSRISGNVYDAKYRAKEQGQ